MMTPEQRLDRLERVAKLFVTAGLRARTQSREQSEKINILINMHIQNEEQWRAENHALDEKISILIDAQMKTTEQIKKTTEQVNETSEQIKKTSEAQKLTDKSLRAFIDSLRKGGNGTTS